MQKKKHTHAYTMLQQQGRSNGRRKPCDDARGRVRVRLATCPFSPSRLSQCASQHMVFFFGKCREVDAGKQARKGKVFLKDTATREERRRLLACANPITSKKLSGQGTVQLLHSSRSGDPLILILCVHEDEPYKLRPGGAVL